MRMAICFPGSTVVLESGVAVRELQPASDTVHRNRRFILACIRNMFRLADMALPFLWWRRLQQAFQQESKFAHL
jgi:hypothetical protein